MPRFATALAEAGFVENQNVAIEFRFSEGRDDHLPSLAADLVGLNVAVFVTTDYPFGGGGQIVRVNRSNRSNRQTAECMRGGLVGEIITLAIPCVFRLH